MTSTLFPDTLSRLLRRPSAPNLRTSSRSSSSSSSPTLRANRDSFEDEEIAAQHAFPSRVESGMRASVSLDRLPVEGLGIDIAWADEPESSPAVAANSSREQSYFASIPFSTPSRRTQNTSNSSLAGVLESSSPFSFPSSASSSRPCSPMPSVTASRAKVQPNLRRVRAASSVLAQLSHALQEDAEEALAKRVRTTSHPAPQTTSRPTRYRTHSEHDALHLADVASTHQQLSPTTRSMGSRFLSLPSRQGSLPWLLGAAKSSSPSSSPTTPDTSAELSGVFTPPPAYSSGEEDTHDGEADDDAEQEDQEAFTLDLYLSSLTHLLSALPASHAKALPAKQKAALATALRDALVALESEPAPQQSLGEAPLVSLNTSGAAEWVALQQQSPQRVHHLHAHTHHIFHHHGVLSAAQLVTPTQAQLAQVSSNEAFGMIVDSEAAARKERSRRRQAAAMLALPALELGLSLTAAALSISARAAAKLVAPFENELAKSKASPPSSAPSQAHCTNCGHSSNTLSLDTVVQRATRDSSQWEAPLALAKAAGSALYVQLSAAAHRASASPTGSPRTEAETLALTPEAVASQSENVEVPYAVVHLARAVKRSPLPTALSQVTATLAHTASLIDARYALRSRCADAALRNTSKALRYVRRNELHTRAVAVAWEAAEAGVAAVQAYREQEAWQGGLGMPDKRVELH